MLFNGGPDSGPRAALIAAASGALMWAVLFLGVLALALRTAERRGRVMPTAGVIVGILVVVETLLQASAGRVPIGSGSTRVTALLFAFLGAGVALLWRHHRERLNDPYFTAVLGGGAGAGLLLAIVVLATYPGQAATLAAAAALGTLSGHARDHLPV